jgi:undecaprenyl-diphosphatase
LEIFGGQVRVFKELLHRGSFPSGHTQIAFGVATYLASRFKKYWWLFYSGAVCMGISRIYVGSHFPMDVLAGAIVGMLVSLIMIKLAKID